MKRHVFTNTGGIPSSARRATAALFAFCLMLALAALPARAQQAADEAAEPAAEAELPPSQPAEPADAEADAKPAADPAEPEPPSLDDLPELPADLPDPVPASGDDQPATELAQDPEIDQRFELAVVSASELQSIVEGKMISLDEALRVTLLNQPAIQMAREDVELARAAVLQAAAPFDFFLLAEFEHGRSYTPLPDAQIQAQREAKRNLQAISREVKRVRRGEGDGKVTISQTDSRGRKRESVIDISNLAGAGLDIGGVDTSFPPTSEIALARQLESQANFMNMIAPSAATRASAINARELNRDLQAQRARTLRLLDRTFDRVLERFEIQTTARANRTTYMVGASKLTRSGIVLNPHLDFQRSGTDNTASINFDFFIPLLQGRGAIRERANEDAAMIDFDASLWQLRHEVALAVLNTTFAYWNCLSAQQDLALLRSSEDIARSFSELSDLRVENGDLSAGEAAQSMSRLISVEGQRIIAEFALLEARHQLGLAMGLRDAHLFDPPYASGRLPGAIDASALQSIAPADLVRRSLILRDDQRAAVQLTRSGMVLAQAARFDIKPVADLFFKFSYTALDTGSQFERNFSAFTDNKVGLGAFGGVNMEWPLQLSGSRANYHTNLAFYRQRRLSAIDLERQIVSGVAVARAETLNTSLRIASARRGADFSRTALEAERARFNEGETALLDAILIEQQYTDSLRNLIISQLSHALAATRFRFETGTLLEPTDLTDVTAVRVDATSLLAVPDWTRYADQPIAAPPTSFERRPEPLLHRIGIGGLPDIQRDAPPYHPGEGWTSEGGKGGSTGLPQPQVEAQMRRPVAPAPAPPAAAPGTGASLSPSPEPAPERPRPLLNRMFGR